MYQDPYRHTTESCALYKVTYVTAMRKNKDDTDDSASDSKERNATVRDSASGALSMARRTVAQDNAPINNNNAPINNDNAPINHNSDLNDHIK